MENTSTNSGFTGEGFASFPNLHSDAQEVLKVTEWDSERHNYKTAEYRAFMRREHLMPRAQALGQYILDRLEFEGDCRDGLYDEQLNRELEERVYGNAA